MASGFKFQCSICLETFTNPASLPCGHNFCLECIKHYWDTRLRKPADCPLCKETFKRPPELRTNVDLKYISEQFKRSVKDKPITKSAPVVRPKRSSQRQYSVSEDIGCDICPKNKDTAVKSCLVCLESYCETHLIPHLRDPVLTKHRLTDPATFVSSCSYHRKPLEMFCNQDHTLLCMKCTESHKGHELYPIENQGQKVKNQMQKKEAEFQQMIRERIRKIQEITDSVEMSKKLKEREIQTSIQFFTEMKSDIERIQVLLIEEIEQKQEAAEKKAQELLGELEQEVKELERRCSKLQLLVQSHDLIHLLKTFHPLSAPVSTRDWSKVQVQSDHYIGTVRRVFSRLVETCQELEKKLTAEEVNKASQYAVDVTLDPATASGWLILSPDGKKVSVSSQKRKLPTPEADDARRFDSCVSVLGKQSFTSGKQYWVIQVGDKTDWDVGVARDSINRKGALMVRPSSGYWAICRRKGGSLSACAGPSITLFLRETPQKVGVFLDFEEKAVSFYDSEAKSHIYTFNGCSLTEPQLPYFNPCLQDNGRNSAPLVICPVQQVLPEETEEVKV